MKNHSELVLERWELFDKLRNAIKSGYDTIDITHDKYVPDIDDVLSTWVYSSRTFLIYAIDYGNVDAAENILNVAGPNVLEKLLTAESEIEDGNGKVLRYTALSYAKEKGFTKLADKIRERMKELNNHRL